MSNDEPGPARPRAHSGTAAAIQGILRFIEPEENPAGVVYGTIAVGTVLAAESARRDTFPDTIVATVLVLLLYWLAHTYAGVTGERLKTRESLSWPRLWRSFVHEAAIAKGAALPVAVLLVLWATPVTLNTAVLVALWTSAASLTFYEVVAAFRSPLSARERFLQVLLGSLLGAGVLVVRLLLH
jgi:hypothetical protein